MDMTSITSTDAQIAMIRGQSESAAQKVQALQGKNADMKRIDESAQEFEAMFIAAMMRPMFEGIEPDELFGGGKGEEIFSDLMLDEYGKDIAASGGLGIADMVKAELIRQQEGLYAQ